MGTRAAQDKTTTPTTGEATSPAPNVRRGRRQPDTAEATIQQFRTRITDRVYLPANQLRPHPKNPKVHPKGQRSALEGILSQIGFAGSLLVRELPAPDGAYTHELINGHLRTEIMGKRAVPVDVCDLNDGEVDVLLATYDPVGAAAEVNRERLAELLRTVEIRHAGMRSIVEALAARCRGLTLRDARNRDGQADRADELAAKWKTERGQVWLVRSKTSPRESHRLMCGDALSKVDMARLCPVPAEMGFTSPPYNMKMNSSRNSNSGESKYRSGDESRSDAEYLKFLLDFTANQIDFCKYFFCNIQSVVGNRAALIDYLHGMRDFYRDTVIWDKIHPSISMNHRVVNPRYEYVHVFSPKTNKGGQRQVGTKRFLGTVDNIVQLSPRGKNENADVHRAVFPPDLARWFIENFTNPGETVVDCFMGTGSTMIAAESAGRLACGMEIDPGYVAVQLERAKDAGLKVDLSK